MHQVITVDILFVADLSIFFFFNRANNFIQFFAMEAKMNIRHFCLFYAVLAVPYRGSIVLIKLC